VFGSSFRRKSEDRSMGNPVIIFRVRGKGDVSGQDHHFETQREKESGRKSLGERICEMHRGLPGWAQIGRGRPQKEKRRVAESTWNGEFVPLAWRTVHTGETAAEQAGKKK